MKKEVITFYFLSVAVLSTGCPGTAQYLSGSNINDFRGCTSVEGNLIINQMSLSGNATAIPSVPPITLNQLAYLEDVQQISGYLHIHDLNNQNITNLRFLRNLEVVTGNSTVSQRTGEYGFVVENNEYLQTLGFASLQRIENGGIRIMSNPELCLVDTLTLADFLVSVVLARSGGLGTDCTDYRCDVECVMGRGCWGTQPDECVECRNYNYVGTCLSSCDLNVSVANDSTMQCIPLAAPPTTTDVTTVTATTMPTTASHPHTAHPPTQPPTHLSTNHPQSPNTQNPITPTTSVPTTDDTTQEKLPFWATIIIPILMTLLLLFLLVGLMAICYGNFRSKNKSQNKGSHNNTVEDMESDINSYKTRSKISLRDLSSRRLQKFVRNHSPIKSNALNSSGTYNMVPVEESLSKLLTHSPTLSDARSSFEGRIPMNNYHNHSRTMHPGVYSTREPPSSHPHRSTHLTHRGSVSSVRGGRGSRSTSIPGQSSTMSTTNNSTVQLN